LSIRALPRFISLLIFVVLLLFGVSARAEAQESEPSVRQGAFQPTGSMAIPRVNHVAALLPDGTVIVAGGSESNSAEVYDPNTGTFHSVGNMMSSRDNATATPLLDGRVLVAGGQGRDPSDDLFIRRALASAEIYDPGRQTFTPT
jgi:hypothetical protein